MASSFTSKNVDSTDGTTKSKSYFLKTVCLKDWWLVKAEKDFDGKKLAVAGITSGEKQAVRVFFSAPIFKIYDVFSLETVDGISVILDGFMNKARTEENGFPSEVCKHFVFGFPPCWEVYALKCLEGESTHGNPDIKKLTPQARRTAGSSKGLAKNFDKAYSEADTQEYSKNENSGVKSNTKEETKRNSRVVEGKSAFDSTSCLVASRTEILSGDSSVKSRKSLELSTNHGDNGITEPLSSSQFGEDSASSSIKGNAHDTANENYGGKKCRVKNLQDHCTNIHLSACHLMKKRECTTKQSLEALSRVKYRDKLRKRMVFSSETDLLEVVSSNSVAEETALSDKKVKGKFKDNQMFDGKLENVKVMLVSLSRRGSNAVRNARTKLDDPPREKSAPDSPEVQLQELTDDMVSRNPDAGSLGDHAVLDCGVSLSVKDSKQVKNHGGFQEKGGTENKTDGYIASGAHARKRKKKIASDEQSNPRSKSVSTRSARRKLAYDSPPQKEKESSIVSPQSLSLKRSRSGRWLLPSLEFWRNQRVFYDADRQITGIKDLQRSALV